MPAKKTPTKKPVAKKPAVKTVVKNAERKFDQVKRQFEEEADFVKEESKVIASGIGKWWEKSSTEEKVYTILGIIALIWGLYVLKNMIWGLLLIIVGILFVTGYFVKKE
ncbi:MAG: hypothetical protein PHR61_04395 [Candidatus Absconditabacteria bacterium]|nr:hypothetical protein [Candidatus Absconditabacteria bacterium]